MDDLREFEQALSEIEELREKSAYFNGLGGVAQTTAYNAAIGKVRNAMEKWRKRHAEQNRPLSIDFGEPLPEILKMQCGFGEE